MFALNKGNITRLPDIDLFWRHFVEPGLSHTTNILPACLYAFVDGTH